MEHHKNKLLIFIKPSIIKFYVNRIYLSKVTNLFTKLFYFTPLCNLIKLIFK